IADIDPARRLPQHPLAGEPPSPLQPPSGCAFHPRCRHALPECGADIPPSHAEGGRYHACVHPRLPC
ncbi:ABC transporter ATP-binding protein, partial [Pseudomonas soli]